MLKAKFGLDRLENIIQRCREEDPKAQEALYRMFAGKMFSLCLRYAQSYEEAQDNLQEGFIKVFKNIRQFRFEGSFEGWVRRIMVNVSIQEYRSQYRLYPLSGQEKNEALCLDNISDHVSEEDLMRLIRELPPRYRLVFNMYSIEGYSHKEIAEQLDITEGTSKSNLSRAREILQEKLKKYYDKSVIMGS